jgi:ribosomal peptide maturation radical SAM protein 1
MIVFVNPPGAAIERPSIALGTLKRVLVDAGFSVTVQYANLWYAEEVSLELAHILSYVHTKEALLEWVFAGAAFPDFAPDHDRYLARALAKVPHLAHVLSAHRLVELRRNANDFIHQTALKVLAAKPRVVGCTSTFSQHTPALAILRRVHDLDASIITMLGGANCESVMGRTTHASFKWVDYVVSGEAEELLPRLMDGVFRNGRDIPLGELPEGVFAPAHRSIGYPMTSCGDGAPRAIVASMNVVPIPDYDEYFSELQHASFKEQIRPGLPIETSRGCWWGARLHCTFCGLNGGSMRFRGKAPGAVLDELRFLSERHGVSAFEAVDNIVDQSFFESLFPQLDEGTGEARYELFYELTPNIRRSQVEVLARAGVRWVQPGIESFSSGVLRLTRKGSTPWRNITALKWFRQYGIRVIWNLLYGVPGEKDAWYAEQARLIPALTHLEPCAVSEIQFCRYSPYFNQPDDYHLSLNPCEGYRSVYPVAPDLLRDLVYFFEDERLNAVQNDAANVPGARDFMAQIIQWRRTWHDDKPPECVLVDAGGEHFIIDTRPGAIEPRSHLDGLAVAILTAAEEGVNCPSCRRVYPIPC